MVDGLEIERKWKWIAVDIYDIDCFESWLSDMAEKGCFFEEMGNYRACFIKGEPRHVRYRIDVLSRKLTEDELALYDACGWHCVTGQKETYFLSSKVRFYIFETDENAAVPELHTDPLDQAESLRQLHRKSIRDFWLMAITIAALAGYVVYRIFFSAPVRRFNALVYGFNNAHLLFFYLLLTMQEGYHWQSIRRLRKHLAMGDTLNHHADYHAAKHKHLILKSLYFLFAFCWLSFIIIQIAQGNCVTLLPEEELDFPAVRLEELVELNGMQDLESLEGQRRHEWTGVFVVEDDIDESGFVESGGISLSTTCYRLPFAWESKIVLEGMIAEKGVPLREAVSVCTKLVDEAWILKVPSGPYRVKESQVLLACEGRYVVEVTYRCKIGELAAIFPLLEERLDGAKK